MTNELDSTPSVSRTRIAPRPILGSGEAIALVLGATLFAAADLGRRIVLPDDQVTGVPDMVNRVTAHSGVWLALGAAVIVGSFAMLPGVLALVGRHDQGHPDPGWTSRGRLTLRVGGWLLVTGLVASVAHALAFYGMAAIDGTSGASMEAVIAMEDASNRYPLFVLVIVLFILGMALGPILVTWGMRRAGLLPIWVPVAALVFAVTGTLGGVVAGIVGLITAFVTFGMMGRALVETTTM